MSILKWNAKNNLFLINLKGLEMFIFRFKSMQKIYLYETLVLLTFISASKPPNMINMCFIKMLYFFEFLKIVIRQHLKRYFTWCPNKFIISNQNEHNQTNSNKRRFRQQSQIFKDKKIQLSIRNNVQRESDEGWSEMQAVPEIFEKANMKNDK